MHIQIETSPVGPLRVIATLPSARVAMLEGLNGIGKSLAVRLLELCVGEMPYRTDSAAWQSLCVGLGEFSVTLSALDGAQAVHWEGDSRDWAGASLADGGVTFRTMTIDGRSASMDDIRRLVRVHRLSGDEDLVETLSQQADDAADRLRRWFRRHADAETGPLHDLESRMGEVSELLGDWTLDRFASLGRAVTEAHDRLGERARAVAQLRDRREALFEAQRIRRQLVQLETDLPSIRAELESVDSEIAELRTELERNQHELTTLAGQVATAGPVVRELRNARRTLERNHSNLAHALDGLARRAAEADVAPDVASIEAAIAGVQQDLDEWLALRAEYDQAPDMRDLIDGSVASLSQAETSGLGMQVFIEDPETDLQLTVSESRHGMLVRREILEGQPPPPEAEELAAAIAAAERRLALLGDVKARAIEAARFRRLVNDNQDRVDQALRAFDPDAVDRLQELEAQRRQRDERVLELATRRATLVQQAGGVASSATVEQTAADLSGILELLGLDADQVPDELGTVDAALNAANAAQRDAEAHHRQLRRDLARAEADVRRTTAVLSSEYWNWLVEALPAGAVPNVDDQIDQQVASLEAARDAADRVVDRLGDHRGQIAAVEQGLRGLARRLRGHELETRRYVDRLESWLGDHYSEWFNIPRVRAELLPAADGPIYVDLHTAEVRWTEDGAERSRPLEAFSSGEQAFAYTRARLAILDEEENPPANRLVVLDEFGAFIAHDRLAALIAHLQDRVVDHPTDQVVVILPLTRDYASLAENSVGPDAARYSELERQIEDRGYVLQELVP